MTPTLLPLDAIALDTLPRDRTALDPTAIEELRLSILRDGLRQPIEVMELVDPPPGGPSHGLLSGLRRLTVFRGLRDDFPGHDRWATIPALVRLPDTLADALRQMVEENDIRAAITPRDQARIALDCVPAVFATADAAVAELYRSADRQRRARIRAVCTVIEELGPLLIDPAALSQRQLLRLAAACRGGFTDLIETALAQSASRSAAGQWRILDTILLEAEAEARAPEPPDPRPGRPRRFVRPRAGLWIRREKTREGWSLHFTGKEANGPLMEDIMDEVERLVGR